MPLKWKLFWIVCLLQMLSASFFAITGLIRFFETGSFSSFMGILLFLLIFLLAILAVNILHNNYPDVPITGKQKSNFNRLFLLNFIFLIFLFGIIFSEYRQLRVLAEFTGKPVYQLPFELLILLLIYFIILIFQLIILYGLYVLRRELYSSFMNKQFEFEKDQLK